MAWTIPQIFTRQKLTYQMLNILTAAIKAYVDLLLLISDCVSTNTPLKVVKRDASGNFAARTITAVGFSGPLTGDVTGDLTGDVKAGSTINAVALTDIFEADKTTVKKATLADTATIADTATTCTGNSATASTANYATNAGNGASRYRTTGTYTGTLDHTITHNLNTNTPTVLLYRMSDNYYSLNSSNSTGAQFKVINSNSINILIAAGTWTIDVLKFG